MKTSKKLREWNEQTLPQPLLSLYYTGQTIFRPSHLFVVVWLYDRGAHYHYVTITDMRYRTLCLLYYVLMDGTSQLHRAERRRERAYSIFCLTVGWYILEKFLLPTLNTKLTLLKFLQISVKWHNIWINKILELLTYHIIKQYKDVCKITSFFLRSVQTYMTAKWLIYRQDPDLNVNLPLCKLYRARIHQLIVLYLIV